MKKYIILLLFIYAPSSLACKLAEISEIRKDIEKAFIQKSFSNILEKYGAHQLIVLKAESEYNEDEPIEIHKFNNIPQLNKWFWKMHQYTQNMIIPEPATCNKFGCTYEWPKNTLHHGKAYTYIGANLNKHLGTSKNPL